MHTRSFYTKILTSLISILSSISRWKTDVNSFPSLDSQIENGPTFVYEYNTRETYGQNITGWGPNDPLNATWWHLVTEGTYKDFFGSIQVSDPPWIYISYASRFFFGYCKLSFGAKLSNRWFLVGFIDVQHITGQRICSDASVCWWLYCGQNMLYEEWLYPPGHSQLYTRVRLRTIMYSNKRSNLKERGFFVGIYCTGSYFLFLSLT